MQEDESGKGVRRRAFRLNETFAALGLSESQGHQLVAKGKIRVVRLGPRSPRVTTEEIDRILKEGIR